MSVQSEAAGGVHPDENGNFENFTQYVLIVRMVFDGMSKEYACVLSKKLYEYMKRNKVLLSKRIVDEFLEENNYVSTK